MNFHVISSCVTGRNTSANATISKHPPARIYGRRLPILDFVLSKNEIIANNQTSNVNSDDVFTKMANQQKEELQFITIEEAITRNLSEEILKKIRFLVTNAKVDPSVLRISIETEVFYNIETKETYEVRKNVTTNEYEVYKDSQKETIDYQQNDSLEEIEYQETQERTHQKVRTRRKEDEIRRYNNAAFTNIGFLIMNIISLILFGFMIILLNK